MGILMIRAMLLLKANLLVLFGLFSGSATAAETITYRYDAKGSVIKVERSGAVNNGIRAEYSHDRVNNRVNVKVIGSANAGP